MVPTSSGRSEVQAGGGLVAFLVCIAVIAAAVWYATREDEQDTDSHAEYVQECQDDGYTEADCEASWSNDPSYTWTGQLSGTVEESTYYEPSQSEAYIDECQEDGYSEAECAASWGSDPSYTWTGDLYETEDDSDDPSQSEVYILECQADGYAEVDCEASWLNDPSYTWTGVLY